MNKKNLLFAGILCGTLAPAMLSADCRGCGECVGPAKKSKAPFSEEQFIEDTLVRYYKGKITGKKSHLVKEDYDKVVKLVKRKPTNFGHLFDKILERVAMVFQVAAIQSETTLDDIEDELNSLLNAKINIEVGKGAQPAGLKKELKREESGEKLAGEV